MSSVAEPVAHAFAFRWGHLQEEPPECVDHLMTELTVALTEAEQAGEKTRAERLDVIIGTLARGIAEHKRRANGGFHTATLERAMAEIRAHERRKESAASRDAIPRGRRTGEDRMLRVAPCRRPK